MRHTLALKIKIIIYAVVFFVLSAAIGFIYISIQKVYTADYINKVMPFVSRHSKSIDYYLEDYEKKAQLIAKDRRIIEMLAKNKYDPEVNYLLTEMVKSYGDILGVSVYTNNYAYFSDKLVGNAPNRDFIIEEYITDEFIQSDDVMMWVVRSKDGYQGFYYRSSYFTENQGLYTCIYKLFNSDKQCIGYLLLDTGLNNLFKSYSDNNNFITYENLYLIIEKNKILTYQGNRGDTTGEIEFIQSSKFNNTVRKGKAYNFQKIQKSENMIVVCVPAKSVSKDFGTLIMLLLTSALLIFLVSAVAGKLLISSIIDPIVKLQQKISAYSENVDGEEK